MSDIEFCILGPLLAREAAGGHPIDLGEKVERLLARLLVMSGVAVTAGRLEADLWGEERAPARPHEALHQLVRRLRERLDRADEGRSRAIVVSERSSYRIETDWLRIDARRFERLVDAGRETLRSRPRAARIMLAEALGSWRGPLLAGHEDLAWVVYHAGPLELLREEAELHHNEALLALGEHARAEVPLRSQIARRPTDERLHVQLIRALTAMRRDVEALVAYRAAVETLGPPGGELGELGGLIARGGRPAAAPRQPAGPRRRPDSVLLHAVLEPRVRQPGEPGLGTAVLLAQMEGGDTHPLHGDRVAAAFDDAAAARRVARRLADDPSLRCAVGIHAGGLVQVTDRLVGPGPGRCRLVADAAHPGQILVSAAARSHFGASDLADLGPQRYEDLQPSEPASELRRDGEPGGFPPPKTLDRLPHNLPAQRDRFVGRDRELAEISPWLTGGEIVTLVGTGGSGKTRLALQLAARRLVDFADGAWFVELAELEAGAAADEVAAAAVSRLGIRPGPGELPQATLVRHLSDRSALLVLDNCEHVLSGCAELVAEMHIGCPRACIVATSRERLDVAGERAVAVRPMAFETTPDADSLPDAVELLLERAGALPDEVAGSQDLVELTVRICEALDGIPLAIELAAGQFATRGPAGVAAEVDAMIEGERTLGAFHSSDPARPPRHRTIEATIRWSHDLLSPHEQRVLHRLAVFRGSFGIAEAEAVTATGEGGADVAQAVARLVACSMVGSEQPLAGATRLRLNQTIRAFALRELEEAGELKRTRAAHARVYAELAARIAPSFFTSEEQTALDRLAAEHDNLRTALSYILEKGRAREAFRLVGAMWWLWFSRGHLKEGCDAVAAALRMEDEPSLERGRVLRVGSHLEWWRGNYAQTDIYNHALERCAKAIDDEWGIAWAQMGYGAVLIWNAPETALERFEESRRRFDAIGRPWEAGYALQLVALAHAYAGREQVALTSYEELLGIFERLGHGSVLASVRRGLGLMAALCGDARRGRALCRTALAFSNAIGDRAGSGQALNFLATISREGGDSREAAELHADALVRADQIGDLWATCSALDGIASVAAESGEHELAVSLFACADGLTERGYERMPAERARREADGAMLLAALGPSAFDRAHADGEAMTLSEAVASALAFVERLALAVVG
jgi:predicted ATPase/DNA-binding SARP family transcriptional activator